MTIAAREITDVVSRSPIFCSLDPLEARRLRASMDELVLQPGDVLFQPGDEGESLCLVVSGHLIVGRCDDRSARQKVVCLLGPGALCGEVSLFEGSPHSMTTTALSRAVILQIGNEGLSALLGRQPQVAGHLLRALAQRMRRMNDSLDDHAFLDVGGRVAKCLLECAAHFGIDTGGGRLTVELRQQDLAFFVGTARETVSRFLSDFAGRGWVTYSAGVLLILDVESLRRRAGDPSSLASCAEHANGTVAPCPAPIRTRAPSEG